MPKPADKNRDAARRAIRDAIRDHGPTDGPAIARRSFPDVNLQTWKGWVASEKRDARIVAARVLEDVPMPARGPGRPPLDVQPMPMPVSEIRAIADSRRELDSTRSARTPMSFFDRFEAIERDLAKVRNACIRVDPATGNERVINPAALLLCVKEARANLAMAREHASEAHSFERVIELGQAMLDIVGNAIGEFPEEQRRPAILRFRELVAERVAQIERIDPEVARVLGDFGA